MKTVVVLLLVLLSAGCCSAQAGTNDISPAALQQVNGLPLQQAVKTREHYKVPLRDAYARQMALGESDCSSAQGQQPYNVCIGKAGEQASDDFAVFYNNLQMLCHDADQLATLQASEKAWVAYRDSASRSARAAWPDGTGAPGFAGQVTLLLLRDRMRELHTIYGLNIAQ